ncbi:hypothetical protein K440DRAFT_620564 [Wilcoxina mikolae CBS 423.85]|nr:hypothetical protein K440DRAFT_620564 [Wilcoxina mikolae CBS 423.85]
MGLFVDFGNTVPINPTPAPLKGFTLGNEAEVREWVAALVWRPVWPIILSMLPERARYSWDYRLESPTTAITTEGIKLKSFTDIEIIEQWQQNTGEGISVNKQTRLILEYKRPKMVANSRPPNSAVATEDWLAITSQARRYGMERNCNHHVLMDDEVAYFFEFEDVHEENYPTHFLKSGEDLPVRELIAFAAWMAVPPGSTRFLPRYRDYNPTQKPKFPKPYEEDDSDGPAGPDKTSDQRGKSVGGGGSSQAGPSRYPGSSYARSDGPDNSGEIMDISQCSFLVGDIGNLIYEPKFHITT